MAKKWSGDGRFYLPARQIEPYRLWFEFLKIAHVDPNITVDYEFYADWGPFWDLSFKEWWTEDRWRTLFAVDAGVRTLDVGTHIEEDSGAIVVRLPLNRDVAETLVDVQKLLEQHGAGVKFHQVRQGRFGFSEGYEKGFLKYLDSANFNLCLYRLWLKNADKKGRIAKTAVEFYHWATKREGLLRKRGVKPKPQIFPKSIRVIAEAIEDKNPAVSYIEESSSFLRYVRNAKKFAVNAGAGNFPGNRS